MNLKSAYEPYFKIGAAISSKNLRTPAHIKLLKDQFSSFTAENEMKPKFFLDRNSCKKEREKYDRSPALSFERAKKYLDLAKETGLSMRGHTLVWHNQTPKWFFHKDYNESRELADRETMLARLEGYIRGVLTFVQTEYPGVIYAWDVVNEAIDEGDFRKSLWTKTVGTDFVLKAFEFARKYADPSVALFYNDYETALDWKRDLIIEKILKPLLEKKLVDGMGMQSHLLMDHPDPEVYRTALNMYGALGLQIHITELDMHNADPSEESMQKLAKRYQEFFKIYLEAKKSGAANVTSVTFWNLRDEDSWLSGFRRETSYPLLFHGKCEAKEAYYAVLEAAVEKERIDRWEPAYPEEDYIMKEGPKGDRRIFPRRIWTEEEYDYAAAYGFIPNIFCYLHEDEEAHDAMLMVPGGGYCMVCAHEGELPGMEFFDRGMNVFVLTYTTDITMSVPLKKQPLNDLSRAVRFIRKNAEEFGVKDGKLVICGFSAGAHLCGSLAVHYDDVEDKDAQYKEISNRPDGVILGYPVITMGEYTHEGSRDALLGRDPSEEELEYFSLEKQVTEQTPPCFLWQTRTDDLVPVENSYLFAQALRAKNVPFAHYVFPEGFHGLSAANEEYFGGWSGGMYNMEQVMRSVHSVKDGKGVNVSEKRKEELMEQFFSGNDPVFPAPDESLKEDVGLWIALAMAWIRRLK
ncbi:MAG: endo-1,4-beta-xylanase [Lachnospiraceae bacterium]|nr:endo-1,4-beta-xylanase [Lachnospiraceae bacterium]